MSKSCNFCSYVAHIWERELPTLLNINTYFSQPSVLSIWKKDGCSTKHVLSCFNDNIELLIEETNNLGKLAQICSFIRSNDESNLYDINFLKEVFTLFLDRHPAGIAETVVITILNAENETVLNKCKAFERNCNNLDKLLNKENFHIEHNKLKLKYKYINELKDRRHPHFIDDRIAVLEM